MGVRSRMENCGNFALQPGSPGKPFGQQTADTRPPSLFIGMFTPPTGIDQLAEEILFIDREIEVKA